MTGPVTLRRFGPDGLVISETRFDAKALQAEFDAEGLAAKMHALRQQARSAGALDFSRSARITPLLASLAVLAMIVAALPPVPA